VKVWDMVGGGRQVQTKLTMAAPRESSTALEQDAPRLLTSSLDGHIQSFENY
jgi:hypothetical protein